MTSSEEHPSEVPEGGVPARSPRYGLSQRAGSWARSVPALDPNEVDAITDTYAQQDTARSKTYTRRIVENYLQHQKWYFPGKDSTREDAPKLEKAWAYYEHITLARYFVGETTGNQHKQTRAEPGELEEETELYSPLRTRESTLNEWGLGVGLYFSTLRVMSIIFLIAGCINIANLVYYSSANYSGEGGQSNIGFSLIGSTVCTMTEWVVCTDCPTDSWDLNAARDRYGVSVDANGNPISLVLRNECEGAQLPQGMVNWATLLFLILAIALLSIYQRARERRMDEDKLTATDYSVVVKNPPKDAFNPDDWRDFFSQFAEKQVTCVTVGLNNDMLLWKLTLRRIFRNQLRLQLPKTVDMEDEDLVRTAVAEVEREREAEPKGCFCGLIGCTVLPILRLFGMFLPPHVLVDRIFQLTEEIKELQKKHYDVTKVFVTFETEAGQRNALAALSVPGKLDIARNNSNCLPPSALFRGKVLKVTQPTEPNAVRWRDLHVSTMEKIVQRLITFFITLGLIAFAGFCIARIRQRAGPRYSGIMVTIFNVTIPQVVKLLMFFIERHGDEGGRQKSLYLKVTLFRWVNTAILTQIITPFVSTLGAGAQNVLPTISSILWSELFLAPAFRYLDLVGTFKKHVLAPRARTQEMMNWSFQGTPYNLGERYTDFTKVLFVCFFYCALFPSTFFFGAAILTAQYFVDKFCLMRVWESAPFIGTQLAVFSRRYFFTGALLAYAIVASYAWAQFPYDNVCDPADPTQGFQGIYDVKFLNGTSSIVTVNQDESVRFCDQRWRGTTGTAFPANPDWQDKGLFWMTNSQETLVSIYGWTSLVILIVFCVFVFGGTVIKFCMSWIKGSFHPECEDMKIDFINVPEIAAYIPQIKVRAMTYPFLACDVDDIPQTLIGWTDKYSSYDVHNLIFDVPYEGMKRQKRILKTTHSKERICDHEEYETSIKEQERRSAERRSAGEEKQRTARPIFSIVKHYPRNLTKSQAQAGSGIRHSSATGDEAAEVAA